MNTKLLVLISISSVLGCSSQSLSKNKEKEIIYLRVHTNVIEVFNLEKMWGSSEDVEYLKDRNYEYGEFGGRISICSTEKFHCIKGGLNVVVPKGEFEDGKWKFGGIECEMETSSAVEPKKLITCKESSHSVSFVYSPVQGIISYMQSSQPNDRYELIGSKGLFAKDQEH